MNIFYVFFCFFALDSPNLSFSHSVNETVIWSERMQQEIDEIRYTNIFTSYDWFLCDVDLGFNYSTHWGTLVDLK